MSEDVGALTAIADELEIVADRHVTDPIIAASLRVDAGWCRRIAATLDAERAARAEPGLREAAQAVMDVADYYADTNDEPMWDALPVELTDKLAALRAALEAH